MSLARRLAVAALVLTAALGGSERVARAQNAQDERQQDAWGEAIGHAQHASGDPTLAELEASTAERLRVYATRVGLALVVGAEVEPALDERFFDADTGRDEEWELEVPVRVAAVGGVRYGFGAVALDARVRLGLSYADVQWWDGGNWSKNWSESFLVPEVGALVALPVYLGLLPVSLGVYSDLSVLAVPRMGTVASWCVGVEGGLELGADDRWGVGLRVGVDVVSTIFVAVLSLDYRLLGP